MEAEVSPTVSITQFLLEDVIENGKAQFKWTYSDDRFVSPVFTSKQDAYDWFSGPLGKAERFRLNCLQHNYNPDTDLDEPLPEQKCSPDGDACESCQ